jgi:truncated hemoglobin YjbI/CDGSH-type Zn-finger protein
LCDGTHADAKFTDEKAPDRVPDRQDTYVGLQVTVLDNRGTCAHSGFCTDRLASVFHLGKDPFVAPSGSRLDDIIRAVRACPSGALSYAIDGREAREEVDPVREPTIEVSKDGPYRVTGAIPLIDAQGEPEPRNHGASLEHYSLCRCGHSKNKPFCSGMHWYAGFHDPVADADHLPTLFEWAGGLPALTLMTRIFYSKYVPEDALLSPLFANMAPDHPERVAAWLGEVFGGPKAYSGQYGGYPRMISQHIGKGINEAQRARWVALLCQSANDAGLPADAEFRAAFVAYLEWGSRLAVENSQRESRPPLHMPMPRWWWVCDATPGARVSALAPQPEPEPQPVTLPSKGQPVSFAEHIQPLFRRMDRQSMIFAFDLWAHQDVARYAQAILARLDAGTMPCDGAWPTEKVDVFRRWVESGMGA